MQVQLEPSRNHFSLIITFCGLIFFLALVIFFFILRYRRPKNHGNFTGGNINFPAFDGNIYEDQIIVVKATDHLSSASDNEKNVSTKEFVDRSGGLFKTSLARSGSLQGVPNLLKKLPLSMFDQRTAVAMYDFNENDDDTYDGIITDHKNIITRDTTSSVSILSSSSKIPDHPWPNINKNVNDASSLLDDIAVDAVKKNDFGTCQGPFGGSKILEIEFDDREFICPTILKEAVSGFSNCSDIDLC
jgi:hypothetical protein